MSDQLTLEQAAQTHATLDNFWRGPVRQQKEVHKIMFHSFSKGAEWQKEQYKEAIRLMGALIGAYDVRFPDTEQLLVGYTNSEVITKITMELKRLQD